MRWLRLLGYMAVLVPFLVFGFIFCGVIELWNQIRQRDVQ